MLRIMLVAKPVTKVDLASLIGASVSRTGRYPNVQSTDYMRRHMSPFSSQLPESHPQRLGQQVAWGRD